MGPRGFTLPKATTASAKAARAAFFCELCQKGYSRMNEYEAHESSYDHQHKKRLKEMKEMQRQVQSATKKEEKGPLMSIKLGGKKDGDTGGAGFKKGGFKNAFAPIGGGDDTHEEVEVKKEIETEMAVVDEEMDSDITDEEDYYDPKYPTDCMPGCISHVSTNTA